MNVKTIIAKASRAASDNSPLLLTAIGVAGTLTTAYLTHRAAYQASQIITHEESIGGTADSTQGS